MHPDRVGPFYLIKEMLGLINEKSSFVNLSDGGHLENMGLYELVRRRCKYIIVGDGEADKEMTFHGLSDAVRIVIIDMGIKIDIDLDHIYRKEKNEDGSLKIVGSSHHAVGTINYGKSKEEEGYLLYIEDYMARNPDFPHETTADQFFDEAQFEAYRALGMEAGEKTIKKLIELSEMNDEEKEALGKERKDWEIREIVQWSKRLKAI